MMTSLEDERRSANYKPNIWNYDFVESLKSEYTGAAYQLHVQKLKEDLIHVFKHATYFSKLQILKSIEEFGLSNMFEREIEEGLDIIESNYMRSSVNLQGKDIQATALSFRLLRQHGHDVSQDIFIHFIDKKDAFTNGMSTSNVEAIIELLQASHLALEGEDIMAKANSFSYDFLKDVHFHSNLQDNNLSKEVSHTLELPLHWRVPWFEVRYQIGAYAEEPHRNLVLLELAKLNFNMVQAVHQQDLKELSRWWTNLRLIENVSFARDRLVESFLWALGVAPEPHYSCLRKCLTKVIAFILVIDDLYDVYGTLEELECFTRAIERWDSKEIQHFPENVKICIWALHDTIDEIASDIENETSLPRAIALTYLRKAWTDFCKVLLMEAQWCNRGHTPSLEEYLRIASISSSGPLLSLIIFLFETQEIREELTNMWEKQQVDLVHYSSLIIRLCNDLATSTAELERGDTASSILCYMKETNASEDIARRHIKDLISNTWIKINREFISQFNVLKTSANLVRNLARLSHFFYHDRDGFGVQDRETKKLIAQLLAEAL
ncbi:hypothetical protein Ancab_033664 [Ancistrocladus abbreviatus]